MMGMGLREQVFFIWYYYFLERYFSELPTLEVEAILVTDVVAVVGERSLRYSVVAVVSESSAVVVVVEVGGSSAVVAVAIFWRRTSCLESVLWTTNCPLVLACCGLGTAVTFRGNSLLWIQSVFLCIIKYTHDYTQ
jgi:hypothetical protein